MHTTSAAPAAPSSSDSLTLSLVCLLLVFWLGLVSASSWLRLGLEVGQVALDWFALTGWLVGCLAGWLAAGSVNASVSLSYTI